MPVAVTRISGDRVVVAVDPHKASWTAAAVDGSLQPLATVRVPVSRDGYRALRRGFGGHEILPPSSRESRSFRHPVGWLGRVCGR